MNDRTDNPAVEVRDLRKDYRLGKVSLNVLRGVSFTVPHGEFTAIYGHSGSGKSTLLHLIGLLDEPTDGNVLLEETDAWSLPARKRNRLRCRDIGFVFQFYYLLPELNVLENTMLPAMVDQSPLSWMRHRKDLRCRAGELLNELGLGDRLTHRPKELSGGERQRVAIARALVHNPGLLLADEPTGNLDSKTGRSIIDLLMRFNADHGQTILMVTHDDDLATGVHRTLRLEDGRLVE